MATTTHFNLPKPDATKDVDEEFYQLQETLDLLDSILKTLQDAVAAKAAASHTHAISEVVNLATELAAKMPASQTFALDDLTNVSGAAAAPNGYVLVQSALGWLPSSPLAALGTHGHLISEITGLVDALAGKADASATTTALAGKVGVAAQSFTAAEQGQARENIGVFPLTDAVLVQKVTSAVSYVEFDVPASGGECFMHIGLGIRTANDGNITFQTSPLTAFDSGATDYESKWLYAVAAAAVVSGTLQSGAPVITSNFYGDASAQLIPVSFNGLLFAGNANVWPSFMVASSYYSTQPGSAVQNTQVYRRAAGRIAKLRFGHTGGTITRGTFILAKVRGS